MALDSTEIHKLHKMIRLPQQLTANVLFRLVSLYGPSFDTYSLSIAITTFDGILAALSDDQCNTLRDLITAWDDEKLDYSDTEIEADSGTVGIVYSASRRRGNIRDTIADVCGFMIPTGGFTPEVKAATPNRGPRLVC